MNSLRANPIFLLSKATDLLLYKIAKAIFCYCIVTPLKVKSGNSLQNCVTSILLIWMGFAANLTLERGSLAIARPFTNHSMLVM